MIVGFSIVSAAGVFAAVRGWKTESKALLVPGETSHGHYQIELSCESCHTPFGGVEQDACLRCHGEELERADDSHPKSKFTDPRNADRLDQLDALHCVTCHVEHRPARTLAMDVTQPADFCFHCHSDIAQERPSHEGMAFDSCGAPGCHNFHDNRTLNTDYLTKGLEQPRVLAEPRLPVLQAQASKEPALTAADADAPPDKRAAGKHVQEWEKSAHAIAQVNCTDCHGQAEQWVDHPSHDACNECHQAEVKGFLSGHHGMRLIADLSPRLSPMRPELARLPMKKEAAHRELGCQSCHGAHAYDRTVAEVDACLGCHADRHSLLYRDSKHFALVEAERAGRAPEGSGVTCASCHMPLTRDGSIEHNQNDNLRPNDKMVLEVCSHCHGLGFTIDALADRALIERGVEGQPSAHVESLDMVRRKLAGRAPQPASRTP